jgi:hypothetical protein
MAVIITALRHQTPHQKPVSSFISPKLNIAFYFFIERLQYLYLHFQWLNSKSGSSKANETTTVMKSHLK